MSQAIEFSDEELELLVALLTAARDSTALRLAYGESTWTLEDEVWVGKHDREIAAHALVKMRVETLQRKGATGVKMQGWNLLTPDERHLLDQKLQSIQNGERIEPERL